MTTERDLIKRLTKRLEHLQFYTPVYDLPSQSALIDEAHAYLAQPEPEGPTDRELEEFALEHGGGYFNCDCQVEADILTRKHVSNYRAVLARWGRPNSRNGET